MTRVLWANDLSRTLRHANSVLERLAAEPEEVSTAEGIQAIVQSLRSAAHDVWSTDSAAVFEAS